MKQLSLYGDTCLRVEPSRLKDPDRCAHEWYRFVLGFPPYLVRDYLERFQVHVGELILDPFCGTGTTLVECKKLGLKSIGVEANKMVYFASKVKTDWTPDPSKLRRHAERIAKTCEKKLSKQGIADDPAYISLNGQRLKTLSEEQAKLLIKNSISPLPLHKTLVLLDCIAEHVNEEFVSHEKLALAKILVDSVSNLKFGPEVGVGRIKDDAAVIAPWLQQMNEIADDLEVLTDQKKTECKLYHADAREIGNLIEPNSIDAVITSPPYPNEKDYSRTTRLESVVLGFINSKHDLRAMKETFIRSNTRNVYIQDTDDRWVEGNGKIHQIADEIERRRIELGKTSGFERLYSKVTKLYFGGIARHFQALKQVLRSGAHLAYVVGDQASYLRVMIRTGQLLGEIAESLGYKVESIDLFRTRFATATGEDLREEVVVLRWLGN